MNIIDDIRVERYCRNIVFGEKPLISVLYTGNPSYTVEIVQCSYDRPDHIIQPGAKPAAGNNPRMNMTWMKINQLAWSGPF